MPLEEQQLQLFARVGVQLFHYQLAERVIRHCIFAADPSLSSLTLEDVQRLDEKERKKTIGYFLGRLRERLAIAPEFDALLEKFLRDRNDFVHSIDAMAEWNPRTLEGCERGAALMERLDKETQLVVDVFTGLLRAWDVANGVQAAIDASAERLKEMDQNLVPMALSLFGKKDA